MEKESEAKNMQHDGSVDMLLVYAGVAQNVGKEDPAA